MDFSSQESRQANLTGDLWAPSSHITNCTLVECICPLQHCWNPTKSLCNASGNGMPLQNFVEFHVRFGLYM
ncbi:hypothetical protein D5086_014615 [Populus alba]|uniref:Uncharacterized protein n=1 Tax=Populus alba TaxID=43335 RepID=A0ACC4BZH5_POPAL